MPSRLLAAALIALLVASCTGTPAPASGSPAPTTTPSATAGTPGTPAPAGSTAPTNTSAPSPTPVADAGPIAGVWWVRKVLSPGDRSALIPGNAFEDEAFVVEPGCATEPCPTLDVKITPLFHSTPLTEVALKRDAENRYASPAQAENDSPCLNADQDRVQGGATVSSTLRLWMANVRAAGTAIDRAKLLGTLTLDLQPTDIGKAAGCEPETASYELTGSLIAYADQTDKPPAPIPDEPPNTAGGMADLPSINAKAVTGATIEYFPIRGDTINELDQSLANGGIRACGPINYEWHEGDSRPAACAITEFNGLGDAITEKVDSSTGKCTIEKANVRLRMTIELPRWVAPKRVPRRLLDWWRDVVVFIRDHEAGHVEIARARVKQLNTKLRGKECSASLSIIRVWAKELSTAQEEYDRVEYARPWPVAPAGY